jgi:hypothetical protein
MNDSDQHVVENNMIERARLRCPECRSSVLLTAVWAAGDLCPRCSAKLNAARRRPQSDGIVARVRDLLEAPPPSSSIPARSRTEHYV